MHVSITPSAPIDATYITQTANGTLSAEQNLAALATGLLKNANGTGVLSIGIAGTDYQAPGLCVLKAGDTMTGLLTYAQPSTVDAKFYCVNPGDANAKLFNWHIWTSDNVGSARDNVGLNWGYNQASGGGREDVTDQAFYQQLETFYQPASEAQFEYHWDFTDGAGVNLRPMHLNCVRDTGDVNMYWTSDNTYWISAADTNLVQAQIFGAATLAGMEWIHYTPMSIRIDGGALVIRNTTNDIALSISTVAGAAKGAIDSKSELAFSSTVIAGLRLNNLTTTQRNALTPAAGMLIYNTTTGQPEVYTSSWGAMGGGGGTPGGSDTQVQFNDGGAFGGDSLLLWDKTNNRLNVGTAMTEDGTLRLPAGTTAAPAIVFPSSDGGGHTGIYSETATDLIVMRHYSSGAQQNFGYDYIDVIATGFFPSVKLNSRIALQEESTTTMSLGAGYTNINANALLAVTRIAASTNSVLEMAAITRLSSGTPVAAGMGAHIRFALATDGSGVFPYDVGWIKYLWNDAGEGTRKPDVVHTLRDSSAEREIWRGRANGTAPLIGFLGATPVVRQSHINDPSGGATTDAEARTAINSILDILEAFGFMAT